MSKLSRLALNDEGFAFDPGTGDSFIVNRTGLLILRALKGEKGLKETAQMLEEEFDVSHEDAFRDVADFQGRLRNFNIS